MLNDAQRCADDLAAICRQTLARSLPAGPIEDEAQRTRAADEVAHEVASLLAAAALCGLDVGAALRRLLITQGVTE